MAFTQLLKQQARMFDKPADYTDVCEFYTDIDAYVNRNRTCYEGQVIFLKEDETLYVVKKDLSLKGTTVIGKDSNNKQYKNTTGLYYTNVGFTKLNQLTLGADVQVNLGAGQALGGAENGFIFEDDMTFEEVLKKLVQKQVHPTYTKPSCGISMSSNPVCLKQSGNTFIYEIGQSVVPTVNVSFIKNDAGTPSSIKLFKQVGNGTKQLVDQNTSGILSVQFVLPIEILGGEDVKLLAEISYLDGPYKQDNFGKDDPFGSIKSGTITSSQIILKPVRKAFWEFSNSIFSVTNSSEVRNGENVVPSGAHQGGFFVLDSNELKDVQITVVSGVRCIAICYPEFIKDLTYIKASAQSNNNILGNFIKTIVPVYDYSNSNPINYKVYMYTPNAAWGNNDILTISTK